MLGHAARRTRVETRTRESHLTRLLLLILASWNPSLKAAGIEGRLHLSVQYVYQELIEAEVKA